MHCQYHGRHHGAWRCDKCRINLCTVCIPGGDHNFRPGHPHCPECMATLRWQGEHVDKEPFWRMAPQLFRYPLTGPLLVMSFIAGLLTDVFILFDLILLVILVRYGLMVIASMAANSMTLPPITAAIGGDISPFLKQMAALLIMLGGPILLYEGSPMLAATLEIFALLALPANVMLLAVTGSLLASLNPLAWLRLIAVIGAPYILLWFSLLAVQSAPDLLFSLMTEYNAWLWVLINAIGFYSGLVCFAMMGYLLYEHGEELGFHAETARGKNLPPDQFDRLTALGLSHIYAQQGKLSDALKKINRALDSWPLDMALNERKYRLLRLTPEAKALPGFAEEYMHMLLAANNPGSACDIWLDMAALRADYVPQSASLRFAIAEQLVRRQRWRDAASLLVNLHKQAADFPQLGEAYLLLAQVYLEGFTDQVNASKVLAFLAKRFPDVYASEQGQALVALAARI